MKWCIVSVVVGDKYKKFAEVFCDSYSRSMPKNKQVEVVFVVDSESNLNVSHHDFVTVKKLDPNVMTHVNVSRTFGTGTVHKFDYSLKRFGFKECLELGYENICFIDTDMTIRKWDDGVFNGCNTPGLWAGRGYPSSGFGTKPVSNLADVKFTPKLAALIKDLQYNTDWVKYTMPFEAVMFLKDIPKQTIEKFIDCWSYVSEATRRLNLPMNKVTHEIGLAADMCDIPVKYNKQLLGVIFKHYIMNHDVLLDIHSKEIDNK